MADNYQIVNIKISMKALIDILTTVDTANRLQVRPMKGEPLKLVINRKLGKYHGFALFNVKENVAIAVSPTWLNIIRKIVDAKKKGT